MFLLSARLLFFLALVVFPGTVWAELLVMGLSPYQDPAKADAQVKTVLQFLTEAVKPGESALVIDAWHGRSLGTFTVPNKSVYRHPKAKLQVNRSLVATLLAFAKEAQEPKGGREPSMIGAIRLPQALRFVGENYPASTVSDVILLGSPVHDDPKDKGFSMSQGHIPGDGHLARSRQHTPYGIKGQETLLANWRVHLGFPDETWQRDDHHGYFVKRFWTLFIQGQDGVLSTFTSDLPTLFQRVKGNASAPQQSYDVQHTDKLEMILLRPPVVKERTSLYERPITTEPAAAKLVRQAPKVEVGLTWDCGACDLDLHARYGRTGEVLSFLNTHTQEGTYFKDWTRSPRATNGYETVAYQVPVDLKELFLAINFFGGTAVDGVNGELRISLDGRTYAKRFHLDILEGNGGVGQEHTLTSGHAANAHWLVINPLGVVSVQNGTSTLVRQ